MHCMHRWEPEMEQGELSLRHWRKSAQWASLTRKHAQIVSDDVAIADIFAKHCRVVTDKKTGHVYKCIADEVSLDVAQLTLSQFSLQAVT